MCTLDHGKPESNPWALCQRLKKGEQRMLVYIFLNTIRKKVKV